MKFQQQLKRRLEVGETEDLDFRLEIFAIRLPRKAKSMLDNMKEREAKT